MQYNIVTNFKYVFLSGLMRHEDSTLHYYINGIDQGPACENVPLGVYGVIDLYGQCAQVSIMNSAERISNPVTNTLMGSECILNAPQITHRYFFVKQMVTFEAIVANILIIVTWLLLLSV